MGRPQWSMLPHTALPTSGNRLGVHRGKRVAAVLVILPLQMLCGCSEPATSSNDPVVLFEQHCARCHAQAGEPGGPRIGASQGPNLAGLGHRRAPEWVADYIRQPTNRRPNARMPAFEGTLREDQIRALADYLCRRDAPPDPAAERHQP